MYGQVKINGTDLWQGFNGNLVKGAYKSLRGGISAKDYISNESRLESGKRVILEDKEQKFKSRELSISFLIQADTRSSLLDNCDNFIKALSRGIVKFQVPKIGYEFNLIFLEVSDITEYAKDRMRVLKIKFLEPDPTNRTRL